MAATLLLLCGGGGNGQLGVVMPSAQYTLHTLIPFTASVHPGHLPIYALRSRYYWPRYYGKQPLV
jgi:hypothetical protein